MVLQAGLNAFCQIAESVIPIVRPGLTLEQQPQRDTVVLWTKARDDAFERKELRRWSRQLHPSAEQEFEIERVDRGDYRLVRRSTVPNQGAVDWLLACPEKGFFVPIESASTDEL